MTEITCRERRKDMECFSGPTGGSMSESGGKVSSMVMGYTMRRAGRKRSVSGGWVRAIN